MAYSDIKDPSAQFQVETYTGNSTSPRSVTLSGNSDMKPDWTWIKTRSGPYYHYLFDSSRYSGSSYYRLVSSENFAEHVDTVSQLTAFTTDGFTLTGSGSMANVNWNTQNYVAWNWKANGGTTVSNTDGNITSTVQANTTAGFSIVTWTGNENSSASVGHGLGVTPDLVMFKNRSSAYNWVVYLGTLGQVSGNNMFAYLNLTNAAEQGAGITFTSSLLNPGSGASTNASSMIAYCFNNVQGYSKFGKYVGNGSTDGAFVYTGFKPAWVMIKRSDGVTNWRLFDNKRSGFNADTSQLYPNLNNAEDSAGDQLELLSNGFKNRTVSGDQNGSGSNYIYMAFAENPFVAGGIPTTAR